jgi:small subunit ribosomal protein S18
MTYWNQEKKQKLGSKKRTGYRYQSLNRFEKKNAQEKTGKKLKKIKKSLHYLFFLKKHDNEISYTNVRLLQPFLTKSGKIRSRRKTKLSIQSQDKISKAIRRARVMKLIPFVTDLKV